MKANTMVATPSAGAAFTSFAALHQISKASGGRVSKRDPSEAEEMHACFSLLKTLVPTVKPQENISKTELLQHVIDYISELSATLEEADQLDHTFETAPPATTTSNTSDAESEVSN